MTVQTKLIVQNFLVVITVSYVVPGGSALNERKTLVVCDNSWQIKATEQYHILLFSLMKS